MLIDYFLALLLSSKCNRNGLLGSIHWKLYLPLNTERSIANCLCVHCCCFSFVCLFFLWWRLEGVSCESSVLWSGSITMWCINMCELPSIQLV